MRTLIRKTNESASRYKHGCGNNIAHFGNGYGCGSVDNYGLGCGTATRYGKGAGDRGVADMGDGYGRNARLASVLLAIVTRPFVVGGGV